MKFNELPYERPDFENRFQKMKALLAEMENAPTAEALFEAMEALNLHKKYLETQSNLAYVRHTIDTKDAFYNTEKDVFDAEMPRFEEFPAEAARIVLKSKFRPQVAEKYGPHLLEKYEVAQKVFSSEIVEDLVEENKLVSEYQKLMASAEIEFEGEIRNLSGLAPFTQSTDRDMRRRASKAAWTWIASHGPELDAIYDKLVAIRHRIGKKLGYENFIPVAYARMGRTDWTQADARVYRDQIARYVVPLTQKLYHEQAERIGIGEMKYYDYNLEFLSGNPKPKGEEGYLVEQAKVMYHELSPETDAFFSLMTGQGLMDLTTKPGKAPGGYMTFFPDYKMPFIFSNFNGTSGDVDVLTHEAGHALQGYLQRDIDFTDLTSMTAEVAEIHSMSMEYFTHPWLERFFGDDIEKYYYSHVADALKFLPYGAAIDEFQEWVYEHPEASSDERHNAFREIDRKYRPHLDYDGMGFLEKGGAWQRQLHVYHYPFYYLDYTLSQICAFQYFVNDRQDHQKAWESYLTLSRESGLVPFKALIAKAGLKSPFDEGTIGTITPQLEAFMDGLDKSKIK